MNPAEILDKFSSKTMELLPPQVYELSRLRTFSQLDDLSSFAKKRRSMGCERWMNVGIRCTDGLLLVLPGMHFVLFERGEYPIITNICNDVWEMHTVEKVKLALSSTRRLADDHCKVRFYLNIRYFSKPIAFGTCTCSVYLNLFSI